MISVIVPVYNSQAYLRTCLDSLLRQTLEDIEIILVNDGSSDSSPEICDEYARRYQNIRIVHQKHSGQSVARNVGIQIASGAHIAFVDSDDMIDHDMYAILLDSLERNNADIAVCSITRITEEGSFVLNNPRKFDSVLSGDMALIDLFKNQMSCSICNKLFKKEIVSNLRFIPGRTNQDFPFLVEALLGARFVVTTNRGLYKYFKRIGSTSQKDFDKTRFDKFTNSLEVYEKIKLLRPKLKRFAHSYNCHHAFFLVKTMLLNDLEKAYKPEYSLMLRTLRKSALSIIFFDFWPLHHRLSKIYLALFPRIYARRHSGKG